MNDVCRELFKAIHQGKWLTIAYKNRKEELTRYWIAIKDLNPKTRTLRVDGLHLGWLTVQELPVCIDRIQSASIVEGSWCEINHKLVEDIRINPIRYTGLFENPVNLRILNYLQECNKLDSTPYQTEYSLIEYFDIDCFAQGACYLSDEQYTEIVRRFQVQTLNEQKKDKLVLKQLGLNVVSIETKEGLYVLAYRPLYLDVKEKQLRCGDEIVICREFTIAGEKQSIRQFLDAEDYPLLEEFEKNQEIIKNQITKNGRGNRLVNDMPYILAIGRDCLVDLEKEYKGILKIMQESGHNKKTTPSPINAFFGNLTSRPIRRKSYPLALMNQQVNLDQLLAINNAMRYPLAYVQGPPGTGKTSTIINTIMTAFFNERTVLFASYNNHPIDGVYQALCKLGYRGKKIPFPIIRLGSNEKVLEALDTIRKLHEMTQSIQIYEGALDKKRTERAERAKQLTELLNRYDQMRDLNERKETIERLLESHTHMNFQFELQTGQLQAVEQKLQTMGEITTEDALSLLDNNQEEFLNYLYYTSARYIKRLNEPKYAELKEIIYAENNYEAVQKFNKYLSKTENLKLFQRIFPIIVTTCISAHKLGGAEPLFDMTILDEASQCNIAVSLLPILRGENLMLVGDPQQLNPVILLDPLDNKVLRKKYGISDEYDYIENSIYKTFLACDSVSDEVLLSHHYRCHPKIIGFNNRKYYHGKLQVHSKVECESPLVFVDVPNNVADTKNTAPREAEEIVNYIHQNPDKKIGVITPFTAQKQYITHKIVTRGLHNATCGTVHTFQGDEKDVILFSLALTDQTHHTTYDWLKNNKELINVAISRAREQLVVFSSVKNIKRLHGDQHEDDLYDLVRYVYTNGTSTVVEKPSVSRALGVKPYSSKTEAAFLENLSHALDNTFTGGNRCVVHKEVPISQVFQDNSSYNDLFYTGRFDFVVYEKENRREIPVLAIELDGKEHIEDEIVQMRDRKKESICREHGFELIRVENSYARRYYYIKDILIRYFSGKR